MQKGSLEASNNNYVTRRVRNLKNFEELGLVGQSNYSFSASFVFLSACLTGLQEYSDTLNYVMEEYEGVENWISSTSGSTGCFWSQ